jgi:hypothetical protein
MQSLEQRVLAWAGEMEGVFAMSDLRVILGDCTEAAIFKRIQSLVREGVLVKVLRGLYATPGASLSVVSSRINPEAYLTTGTILARKAIIGSIPARRIQAVKVGRPRVYTTGLGVVEHLSIAANLYFGFVEEDGCRCATPEKAFIDTCYYYYRGKRFSFDPATDVNLESLKPDLIDEYLTRYDPRCADFVKNVMKRHA